MPLLAAFAGAIWLAVPVQTGEEPLDVFVLAGQSNMDGRADPAGLPGELQQAQERALVYGGKARKPLTPGKQFGPDISFGKAMAAALGKPVGIIKFAKGGTNLADDWSPDNPVGLYVKLAGMVAAAEKSRPIRIIGMLLPCSRARKETASTWSACARRPTSWRGSRPRPRPGVASCG